MKKREFKISRSPQIERLEPRLTFALRPIAPIGVPTGPDFNYKNGRDTFGATYQLKTLETETIGTLTRCAEGACESIENVTDFSIQDEKLRITYSDGAISVTQLHGSVAEQIVASASSSGRDPEAIRGIVGTISSETDLINRFGAYAPRTLLDSVGRIDAWNILGTPDSRTTKGTGTLLDDGGNRYVLTAAHVVENDKGRTLDPAEIQFVIQTGNDRGSINSGTVYEVSNIIPRSYFGNKDLALLVLRTRVPSSVQGAFLPVNTFTVQTGQQILTAGFGYDSNVRIGNRFYGFSSIDEKPMLVDKKVEGTPWLSNGTHLRYQFDKGEAAIAKGDSGGPDFLPVKSENSPNIWLPVLVGVHSFGELDKVTNAVIPGKSGYSVPVTADVTAAIRKAIPETLHALLDFGITIHEDGDSNISGCGEWFETFTINGVQRTDLVPGFACDRQIIFPSIQNVDVGQVNKVALQLTGYEEDDGFFTGGDDTIPSFQGQINLPNDKFSSTLFTKPADRANTFPTVTGEISYTILWKAKVGWVANRHTISIPTIRGTAPLNDNVLESTVPSREHWRNASNPFDVDSSGNVSALDALVVINEINRNGTGPLLPIYTAASRDFFLDANGDGSLSALDALVVINSMFRIDWAAPELVMAIAITENARSESSPSQDLTLVVPADLSVDAKLVDKTMATWFHDEHAVIPSASLDADFFDDDDAPFPIENWNLGIE